MGLLDGTTQNAYYQGGEKGGYQFTSLEDIINYFMVVYVGEGKTVSKINRTDVAFHAQRAMQELSFDTFKSVKSQEITLPPSNTMMLPHDYVNYTKISWSDGAGIKHPLYPTSNTSNPFKVLQNTDGSYDFTADTGAFVFNADFSDSSLLHTNAGNDFSEWIASWNANNPSIDDTSITDEKLTFTLGSRSLSGTIQSRAYSVVQKVDVTGMDKISLSATGLSAAASSGVKGVGVLRVGFTTRNPLGTDFSPGSEEWNFKQCYMEATVGPGGGWGQTTGNPNPLSRNHTTELFNVYATDGTTRAYVEFSDGLATESTETLEEINVIDLTEIYLVVTSYVSSYTQVWTVGNQNQSVNTVDNIEIIYDGEVEKLQSGGESTTWSSYKSHTPSDNVDKYDDGTYDLVRGERYGIEPQHAQVNGSYYIDNLRGLINFSSNVSGKTVILDYISDSLGTDGEMQVHKFAEEAMYKWIMYAVLSTRANTPEYIVRRYQKEKFAATRTAKLRLSNIKLEELTQILRGKSKWIKH
tara:strand:+ start:634 stop:2208 length:1575 start_codon:yes stop_codon:yes gene_type:complete